MTLEKQSSCKVNLLLNILGKRSDGFHALETVMHPVNLFDRLSFMRAGSSIELTCNHPELPCDRSNLVYRAAESFRQKAGIKDGIRIELEKNIPMAAGLGGGSGNAATTLNGLNELFEAVLSATELQELAASLGSDVPFFLQGEPALATGRGEKVEPLGFLKALRGAAFLLIHPGFGISTAWAYQQLARFPDALNGHAGRAQKLVNLLREADLKAAARELYNSLEAPALYKYPLLAIFQDFLREEGAIAALMSGSGSTTFALMSNLKAGLELEKKVQEKFGPLWTAAVPIT